MQRSRCVLYLLSYLCGVVPFILDCLCCLLAFAAFPSFWVSAVSGLGSLSCLCGLLLLPFSSLSLCCTWFCAAQLFTHLLCLASVFVFTMQAIWFASKPLLTTDLVILLLMDFLCLIFLPSVTTRMAWLLQLWLHFKILYHVLWITEVMWFFYSSIYVIDC